MPHPETGPTSPESPVGPELDAVIQDRIMGVPPKDVRVRGEVDTPLVRVWNASPYWREDGRHDRYSLNLNADAPRFSADIALAWTVLEKMIPNGWLPNIEYDNTRRGKLFYVTLGHMMLDAGYAESETAPHAICLAAISTLEAPHAV